MTAGSVGIVGGGISGLSVAYSLIKKGFGGAITVYEATETLGGNADTAEVLLGTDFRGPAPQPFQRLADLGVNDVNLNAYRLLSAAMLDIGYCAPGFPQDGKLRPLEDSICYFTPDGRETWTNDAYLLGTPEQGPARRHAGVFDLRFSLQSPAHQDLCAAEDLFMAKAAEEFAPGQTEQPWWRLSTRRYVESFRARHLSGPSPLFRPELLDQVVRLFLMPRIAAMYFAADTGPEHMPFRGVMNYYRLQEGYGAGQDGKAARPDRRYFTKGSQDWIDALGHWLQERGVTIRHGFQATVTGTTANGRPAVQIAPVGCSGPVDTVDTVVMANHADHALSAFRHGTDPLLSEEMAETLGKIQHSVSRAVAHTWTGVLPANVNAWRAYNVMIREGIGLKPYQMTYVQNRHRNDALNPGYDLFGLPIYFVTLNPQVPIPDANVLRLPPKHAEDRRLRQAGYGGPMAADDPDADKAVAWFRHTVMTDTLLDIQDGLDKHQGMAGNRVYFAGCWTNGAGLHEQCFEQADKVTTALLR
ncbi:MAG: FAD-dependent oxidoreductase [Qingshengfaniella sp.]